MSDGEMLTRALAETGVLVERLARDCRKIDDADALAEVLMFAAARIHGTIGGRSYAAARFYRYADELAAEAGKPEDAQ